jgi:hypothetical protein
MTLTSCLAVSLLMSGLRSGSVSLPEFTGEVGTPDRPSPPGNVSPGRPPDASQHPPGWDPSPCLP